MRGISLCAYFTCVLFKIASVWVCVNRNRWARKRLNDKVLVFIFISFLFRFVFSFIVFIETNQTTASMAVSTDSAHKGIQERFTAAVNVIRGLPKNGKQTLSFATHLHLNFKSVCSCSIKRQTSTPSTPKQNDLQNKQKFIVCRQLTTWLYTKIKSYYLNCSQLSCAVASLEKHDCKMGSNQTHTKPISVCTVCSPNCALTIPTRIRYGIFFVLFSFVFSFHIYFR